MQMQKKMYTQICLLEFQLILNQFIFKVTKISIMAVNIYPLPILTSV